MNEQKPDAVGEVRQTLITLRIIVFSLAAGVSFFIGYALTSSTPEVAQKPILWMMMAGLAGSAIVARVVIPRIVFATIRRRIAHRTWQPATKGAQPQIKTDEGLLMAALQVKTIIGCAILEAAGFANGFAYMSERQITSLVITLAIILMILAHFPLRFWLDGWLERQKRWIEEERSLIPSDSGVSG